MLALLKNIPTNSNVVGLSDENWGCQTSTHGLAPKTVIKYPESQSLFMTIFCKCAKGCRYTCSCRKSGIKFSSNCANCKGHSCANAPPETHEKFLQLSEDDKKK
ncbi:hypothetical protein AVEN_177322-1 [Araneus ventricosus]|uniref:Tesmin/TSO1-like CXC domain-containing protein n=1 Tax=Araneus ventricosus TaxID=182803 RepID=A0A4Y2C490_ARAVE|nr:hypothetical protein AVEN_177322-1 [Araneus ventricosus]